MKFEGRMRVVAPAAALAAVALMALPGSATSAAVPATSAGADYVIGNWTGTLHQRGVGPFRVWVSITSLGTNPAARVRYSGLDCRGYWTYLGRRGRVTRFRETIVTGRSSKCTGVGTVTLTRRRGSHRLGFRFVGGGLRSAGEIRRTGPVALTG
jgi:hypothetical protein